MTTFPYKGGKPLAWDFTVVDTVCSTCCHTSAKNLAKWLQRLKYRHLTDFHFIPIGAETLGPFGPHAVQFLEDLGNKISNINGERHSIKSFLFQSIGIAIQQAPITPDQPQVKRPPPSLQITSNFLVFHGLSHGTTLEKKCVAQNLIYSKI